MPFRLVIYHRHSRWLEEAPLKGAIHLQIFFYLLLITTLPYPSFLNFGFNICFVYCEASGIIPRSLSGSK
jgi:hypothetical protein